MYILREFKEKIQDFERYKRKYHISKNFIFKGLLILLMSCISVHIYNIYIYVYSFLETHKSSENDERDKPKDRDDSWRT